jgi:hypothetical protein
MNRKFLLAFVALVGTFATAAQGGWHHRHAYSAYPSATYGAYPVQAMPFVAGAFPMQMPANQFQLQLSDAQMQALGSHVAAAQAAQAAAAQPAAAPQAMQNTIDDLRKLVGDLQDRLIDGNAGAGGESGDVSQVSKDLAALRKSLTARVDELDETVELHAKHIVSIHKELKEIKVKLEGKTPGPVKKVLESESFKTTLQGMLKPEVKIDDAIKSLKDKIENSLE